MRLHLNDLKISLTNKLLRHKRPPNPHSPTLQLLIAPTADQKQIIQFVGEIVKAINKKDTSDIDSPPKFTGNDDDDDWEAWYKQLRAYLQAKGRLSTFDHPPGPGSPGFDIDRYK
jgi:hypothetical protein